VDSEPCTVDSLFPAGRGIAPRAGQTVPSPLCPVHCRLLRFLVRLVLAAAVTELLELKTARSRLLVLRRRVIPFLALSALQCHNFPHFKSFQVTDDRLQMTGYRSQSKTAVQTVICNL
jgi:hypothetical protein